MIDKILDALNTKTAALYGCLALVCGMGMLVGLTLDQALLGVIAVTLCNIDLKTRG